MANNGANGSGALGSALVIDDRLLMELEKVDSKLKTIQNTAKDTEAKLTANFGNMAKELNSTLGMGLDEIIKKIQGVATSATAAAQSMSSAASSMGGGLNGAAQSAGNLGSSITGVTTAVNQASASMGEIGHISKASLMQARLEAEKLMNALKLQDGKLISDIQGKIDGINKAIKNEDGTLTHPEQQQLIEKKRMLEEELKELKRTYAEREVNAQKVYERLIKAEEDYQKRVRKAREQGEYRKNTTYEGVLSYAKEAGSYNQMATAVKYLNDVLKNMPMSEQNFIEKSIVLKAEIDRLTDTMKALLVSDKKVEAQELKNAMAEDQHKTKLLELAEAQKRKAAAAEERARRDAAATYQKQNYETNTTYEGSLKFAERANTYNRTQKAVEYLTEAMRKLNRADEDYIQKRDVLNAKIAKLNDNLTVLSSYTNTSSRAESVAPKIAANLKEWQSLNAQVAQMNARQEELNNKIENYQLILERIKSGKGGFNSTQSLDDLKASEAEYAANEKNIALIRAKQQQLVANNKELQHSIQLAEQNRAAMRGSLEEDRSKAVLTRMREYYKELERTSAEQAKRKKALDEEERKYWERARIEEERALESKRARIAQIAAEQRRFEAQQRSQKQDMYNSVFGVQNVSYKGAMTEAKYASTINERLRALELLKTARANLSTEEANYAKKLGEINHEIKRLDKANRDAVQSSKNLGTAYESMTKHHRRLLDTAGQLQRAFALMFSVSQIRNYIAQIARVRGEFELQQRSLEALLQNKTQADLIFNKTVALAVKSPYQIKELVSYTKQLAAYRIEGDKLYDTTKRLADVSAGLGVDMQRIILAYGQVKAAAYLRGTEVRQFTEAGVNLYSELKSYFKDVKGEAYTTAQIVDMISKRKVSFEDVEAIFQRMTDKGGMFYNMQAIQAETLQGKIANLKDSLDIMLNDIGKSNEGTIKGSIDVMNTLLRNWETLANVGKAIAGILLSIKLTSIATGKSISNLYLEAFNEGKIKDIKSGMSGMWIAFTKGAKGARAAVRLLWSSMAANAPLLALSAIIYAVTDVYQRYKKLSEGITKANEEYNKQMSQLKNITDEYKSLDKASNKSASNDVANTEKKRDALSKLLDLMRNSNMKVDIQFNAVKDSELDKIYQENLQRYEDFIKNKKQLSYIIAERESEYNFYGITDNLKEDMDDYDEAMNVALANSTKVEKLTEAIAANYDKMPERLKKYADELLAVEGDDADALQKRLMLWSKMNFEMNRFYDDPKQEKLRKDFKNSISYETQFMYKALQAFSIMRNKQKEVLTQTFDSKSRKWTFEGEAAAIAGELQNQFKKATEEYLKQGLSYTEARLKAKADIELQIDTMQAEEKITSFGAWLLKKAGEWGAMPIKIDTDAAEKQINYIDDLIQRTLGNKTIRLNIITSETGLDKMLGDLDDAKKAYGNYEKWLSLINSKGGGNIYWGMLTDAGSEKNPNKYYDDQFEEWFRKTYNQRDTQFAYNALIPRSALKGYAEYRRKMASDLLKNFGINPNAGNGGKKNNAPKAQRDILSEQIALLKEMQSRYEKLQPMLGDEEAAKRVRDYYAESLRYVKMPQSVLENFVPDKEGVIAALEKIIPTISDFKKRMDAKNTVAEMKIGIDSEALKKDMDKSKEEVETAFKSLDLYNELRKMGVGDGYIRSIFGDMPKTFEDVQRQIQSTFAGKTGPEWDKLRSEQEKKLQEKVVQYNLDTFKELTQAYKTQLSNQLQLDLWYYEEKRKISENIKDPGLQTQYLQNLENQYAKKTSENTWNSFKESDFYIRLFEQMEAQSTAMLTAMREKLQSLKEELKDLTPEQLKEIVKQTQEIDQQLAARNPFKGLASDLKTYTSYLRNRNELESKYLESVKKEDRLKQDKSEQTKRLAAAQEYYDNTVKTNGEQSVQSVNAKILLELEKGKLDIILKELEAQGKITKEQADQIRNGEESQKNLQSRFESFNKHLQSAVSGFSEFESMLGNFGIELPKEISGALSGVSQVSSGIKQIMDGDIVGGAFSAIAGIGNTIGSIFGFGNKDKKLQKEIERHQERVERLQKAYSDLKDSMDKAWSASNVIASTKEVQKNINAQIASLEAMAKAEEDKKKTDKKKVQEYRDQIADLKKQLKELEEQKAQAFGAIGESNYKDAAQEFADAWVDAFNESSNSLDALNEKMDDFIMNMLKKQLMMRAAEKFFKPVFDAFDKMFSEGSDGGEIVTAKELEQFNKMYGEYLEGFNEFAKDMFDQLGILPSGNNDLSKLQQGIQSMSENTGQAVESLLNSIRFFVAQQTSDVSAIRALLSAGGSVAYASESTPMLNELRLQSSILTKIYSTLSSVVAINHPKSGYGIKVFI